MQIIKVAEAKTLEYGFYLWRENAADAWQLAKIVEDGWLELFSEDNTGGSDHFTPYGELLGPVQPAQIATILTNPSIVVEWVNADEQWINDLEEGDEIEMIVKARVSEEGRFTDPKTTHWRAMGTNFFDRL